jgi:hypothetical protein
MFRIPRVRAIFFVARREQVAWFQTIAVPAVKWGAVLRGFTVERPLPKHGDGRAHVLASDSGADE